MGAKRLDIKTGFICNNNCLFCVQAHNKFKGNRTTEEIKKDLQESINRCDSVVFTGGEVTIRKDLLEIVRYAKQIGYSSIQIQSNCRMLSNMNLLKKLIKAGANEFGPALHGPTAEIHDKLTRAPGSFYQTLKAIKNLKQLNQNILTNTVVVKQNYKFLPEIATILSKLKVNTFQFAFVHPIGNAKKNYDEIVPKISLAAPYIHKALQIGIDNGIKVMAEAMPYCLMNGYEQYISERFIPQTEIKTGISFDKNYTTTRINKGKTKFPKCKTCKYDKMCEGPWKEYPEEFGSNEFKPISTEIKNTKKEIHSKNSQIPEVSTNNKPKITLLWTLYSRITKQRMEPNLSIAYLSKVLEKNNFEVDCIDFNLLTYDKWGYDMITSKNKEEILLKLIKETEKTNPDILAIGFWTEGVSFVKEFVKKIKNNNPHLKIILGGHLSTFLPEKILNFIPETDYLVRGEGESTILELINSISKGKDTKKILGISYKNKNNKVINNPNQPLIKDLDDLPLMDFENFVYFGKYDGLNIMSSRGCPFDCTYCSSKNFGQQYRFYSNKYIIKQIKHLVDTYGLNYVAFSDDNVLCNQERTKKLFNKITTEKLDCELPISGRIDNLNKEVFSILKKAKVPWLTIGIENIVPKVLTYYNRTSDPKTYLSKLHKTVELLKNYEIGGAFSFVIGSPIETKEDIAKNLECMHKLSNENFLIYASILRLVPGSTLWNQYTSNKINIFNLNKSSTGFPFDNNYLNTEWICPSNFAFKNKHYSNKQLITILTNTMKKINTYKKY
jgi:MoaA/NifB/PqqE/SkfB family radical SAM enzyme